MSVKFTSAKGKVTNVNIQIKDLKIDKAGIHPKTDAIGWSRMYQHLWKQGQKQLKIADTEVTARQNEIEQWITDGLNKIKGYDSRINPDKINYEDVKHILSSTNYVKLDEFIPFEPDLKNEKDDDWFYTHDSKDPNVRSYKDFFKKVIPDLVGGFSGWWKKIGIEEILINGDYQSEIIDPPAPIDPPELIEQVEEGEEELVGQGVLTPETPVPVYPNSNEIIRIRMPFMNIENVSGGGVKKYEFQISTSSQNFENNLVVGSSTEVNENSNNHDITYAQAPVLLDPKNDNSTPPVSGIYYWRAKAIVNGVSGEYCSAQQITISKNQWSDDGHAWHFPLENGKTPVSGTFMEAYYHAGEHMGVDFGTNKDVFAIRNSIIERDYSLGIGWGTISLIHKSQYESQPISDIPSFLQELYKPDPTDEIDKIDKGIQSLISRGMHMKDRINLAKGVMLNQGTKIGTSSNVVPTNYTAPPVHLHFDMYYDSSLTEFYNCLKFNFVGFEKPKDKNIEINKFFLRNDTYLGNSKSDDFTNYCYVIVRIVDRDRVDGYNILAPYKVEFLVNNVIVRNIQFDVFRKKQGIEGELETHYDEEKDFFAYDTLAQKNSHGKHSERAKSYMFFCKWETKGYLTSISEKAVYELKIRSEDVFENKAEEKSFTIGLELKVDKQIENQIDFILINHSSNVPEVTSNTYSDYDVYSLSIINVNANAETTGENPDELVEIQYASLVISTKTVNNGEEVKLKAVFPDQVTSFTIHAHSKVINDIAVELKCIV